MKSMNSVMKVMFGCLNQNHLTFTAKSFWFSKVHWNYGNVCLLFARMGKQVADIPEESWSTSL